MAVTLTRWQAKAALHKANAPCHNAKATLHNTNVARYNPKATRYNTNGTQHEKARVNVDHDARARRTMSTRPVPRSCLLPEFVTNLDQALVDVP